MTADQIKARQAELRRLAQRHAADLLRSSMNASARTMLELGEIDFPECQEFEDEIFRIIHYLERGRR